MGEIFDWLRHHHDREHRHDPDRPPPEADPPIELNIAAVDQDGALITRALVIRIDAGLSGTVRSTNPANFYNGPALETPWIGDISIIADGYAPWTTGANPQVTLSDATINITATLAPSFKSAPDIPVIVRGPLLPFPEPVNYYTALPWTPPHERDYRRGDFWGVEMPGAPVVGGASSRHPERILTWFLDRYTPEFQQQYLTKYAGYGYTHLLLSYADSTAAVDQPPDKPPGAGQSMEQFIETCRLVKKYGLYAHVRLGSKYFQPANMSAQQWAEFADPVMDALIAAQCVDEFSLGWEWNLWNVPGQTSIDALRHCGQKAKAAGLSSWQHFSPHYTSWFADGDDRGRFGWYDDLAGDVDGIDYQTMGPTWSLQMLQARIVDTLWQFGEDGNRYKFRMEEDLAAWMWDNSEVSVVVDDLPPEQIVSVTPEDANLRGYIGCCSIDDVKGTDAKVWGAGNGIRMPDGSPI
jgi:hypothetical protein